jgi:ribosomal protein S18 acetylase RimI-like enzyme
MRTFVSSIVHLESRWRKGTNFLGRLQKVEVKWVGSILGRPDWTAEAAPKAMAAITKLINPAHSSSGQLRPFDVRRDLSQVADLVEQCFADTLDPDGQRYLGQMRAAAGNAAYLRWAGAAAERVSLPLSGYVWEEDRRIVGNLTLIPFYTPGKKYYLIANVAVDPNYRRKGIARNLTTRAVEHAHRRAADAVWLHVREENDAAVKLYGSLGFVERARRTTWHSNNQGDRYLGDPSGRQDSAGPRIKVGVRQPAEWPSQQHWLNQLYPPELTWHLSLSIPTLRSGLMGSLYRFLSNARIYQWSAYRGSRLLGVLAFQSTYAFADNLWLAADPQDEDSAASVLLRYARQHISPRRPLALDYPAGRAVAAIEQAGFSRHQTLIWMSVPFH